MKKKVLEKDIQHVIIQYLKLKGYFVWRNQTVGIYKKSTGSYIPSQNVGSPDIFVVKQGQCFGIEIKTEKGKQSDKQKEWQRDFEKAGGIYLLVHSLEELEIYNIF